MMQTTFYLVLLESPEEVDFVYQENPLTTESLQKLTEGKSLLMLIHSTDNTIWLKELHEAAVKKRNFL